MIEPANLPTKSKKEGNSAQTPEACACGAEDCRRVSILISQQHVSEESKRKIIELTCTCTAATRIRIDSAGCCAISKRRANPMRQEGGMQTDASAKDSQFW